MTNTNCTELKIILVRVSFQQTCQKIGQQIMHLKVFDLARFGRLGSSRFQHAARVSYVFRTGLFSRPTLTVRVRKSPNLPIKTEPKLTNVYAHSIGRLNQRSRLVDVLHCPPVRAAVFESVVPTLIRPGSRGESSPKAHRS